MEALNDPFFGIRLLPVILCPALPILALVALYEAVTRRPEDGRFRIHDSWLAMACGVAASGIALLVVLRSGWRDLLRGRAFTGLWEILMMQDPGVVLASLCLYADLGVLAAAIYVLLRREKPDGHADSVSN